MNNDLKLGVVGAVGVHAIFLFNFSNFVKPHDFTVITAPSSLEVSLVSVASPKIEPPKIELSKTTPLQPDVLDVKSPKIESYKVEIQKEKFTKVIEISKEQVEMERPVTFKKIEMKSQPNMKTGAFVEAQANHFNNESPVYPRKARKQGYEGDVVLSIAIKKTGFVEGVRIVQSSGYDILDQSAIKSVKKWQFQPAKRFGAAVQSDLEILFIFRLDDE